SMARWSDAKIPASFHHSRADQIDRASAAAIDPLRHVETESSRPAAGGRAKDAAPVAKSRLNDRAENGRVDRERRCPRRRPWWNPAGAWKDQTSETNLR